jgi:hypothetical protein
MKNSRIIIFLLAGVFDLSCSTGENKNESPVDSTAIIESALDRVFKINYFAPEFYANPVKIIKSRNIPGSLTFKINGQNIELVNRQPKHFYRLNVSKPMPFVDVEKFKIIDENTVRLNLGFPSIGNVFEMKIHWKNGKVLNAEQEGNYQTK